MYSTARALQRLIVSHSHSCVLLVAGISDMEALCWLPAKLFRVAVFRFGLTDIDDADE